MVRARRMRSGVAFGVSQSALPTFDGVSDQHAGPPEALASQPTAQLVIIAWPALQVVRVSPLQPGVQTVGASPRVPPSPAPFRVQRVFTQPYPDGQSPLGPQ